VSFYTILVVGVEGSGHHALKDLAQNWLTQSGLSDPVLAKDAEFARRLNRPAWSKRWMPGQRDVAPDRDRIHQWLQAPRHIWIDASIPYGSGFGPPYTYVRGRVRSSFAWVDFHQIAEASLDVGRQVCVIHLRRDPLSCSYSVWRRGHELTKLNACVSTETSMFITQGILASLPSPHLHFDYEEVVSAPVTSVKALKKRFPFTIDLDADKIRSTSPQEPTAFNYFTDYFRTRAIQQCNLPMSRD